MSFPTNQPLRLLRRLLRLFPADHVRDYGDEMWEVISHQYRQRRRRIPKAMFVLGTSADLVSSAARVWIRRFARSARRGLTGLGLELRAGGRSLRRSPAFLMTTTGLLAAAIATNVAVLSFVRGSLLEPPPYSDPDRVVVAWGSNPVAGQVRDVISGSNYVDLAARSTTLEQVAAVHPDEVALQRGGRPEVHGALEVSIDFLAVLGVEPIIGRDFAEGDRYSGAGSTSLVSHDFWRDHLDSDPESIGRPLILDGDPTTVLGVLPPGFRFLAEADFLIPLRDDLLAAENRTHHHYTMIGRLARSASPPAASRELSQILSDIAREDDPRLLSWSVLVEPLHEVSVEAIRPVLRLLTLAVAIVLLIAVVNLAVLYRIRSTERSHELSLRRALGAGRLRTAVLILGETTALSTMGGLAGLLLAKPVLLLLESYAPPSIPIPQSALSTPALNATLDLSVIGVAIAGSVLVGILLAVPTLVSPSGGIGRATAACKPVRRNARTHSGAGAGWLIGVEVALATVLCVGAVLALRSASQLTRADVGLEPDHLLTLVFGDLGPLDSEAKTTYYRRVLERVEAIPGVERAGLNDYLPFQGEDDFQGVLFPNRPRPAPGQGPREEWRRVSEGLFEAAGMRIQRGRGFAPADFETAPRSVVINQAFAAKHFPSEEPIGQRLLVTERGYPDVEIVGIIADVLSAGPAVPPVPVLYAPLQGRPRDTMALYVKVSGDPLAHAQRVQEAIWSVDAQQPIVQVLPMSELLRRVVAVPHMTGGLVGGLAIMALLLAATGVFGVVSYAVRTRQSELGVRLALGATARRLQRELFRESLPSLLTAVTLGLGLAVLGARAANAVLYDVGAADPLSLFTATGVIAVITALSGYLPARRIARISPSSVIRDH